MSLIAPQHATAPSMFKWNNSFSWTYNNMADSIKMKVKKAGGNIDAYFRTSLAWYNTGETIIVAKVYVDANKEITIKPLIESKPLSKQLWNLQTQNFHPVNIIMKSPNYWNGSEIGNLHYFFILNNCQFDLPLRGFLNEYLHNDLHDYRKVFEILGDKMKVDSGIGQLSGLGFSSTLRNDVIVKVSGARTRMMEIIF